MALVLTLIMNLPLSHLNSFTYYLLWIASYIILLVMILMLTCLEGTLTRTPMPFVFIHASSHHVTPTLPCPSNLVLHARGVLSLVLTHTHGWGLLMLTKLHCSCVLMFVDMLSRATALSSISSALLHKLTFTFSYLM